MTVHHRKWSVFGAAAFVAVSLHAQSGAAGRWRTDLFPAVTLHFAVSGSELSGTINSAQNQSVVAAIFDGRIEGSRITFKVRSPDGDRIVTLVGQLAGDQIAFTRAVDVTPGGALGGPGIFGAAGPRTFTVTRTEETGGTVRTVGDGEQTADPDFEARVPLPAFPKGGPRVLIDEAHHNFHTASGRYKPFADLITSDGYQVVANRRRFERGALQRYAIAVIANPRGGDTADETVAAGPAFTDEECEALRTWVSEGGSLLLIADHFPSGASAASLAKRFGVEMRGGWTTDEFNHEASRNIGSLLFSDANRLLGDHAIIRGRSGAERIRRVTTFVGQSLRGAADSTALLKLADTAMDLLPDQRRVSAAGGAQAVALIVGKGRVVVFGEAAALTAQVSVRGRGCRSQAATIVSSCSTSCTGLPEC